MNVRSTAPLIDMPPIEHNTTEQNISEAKSAIFPLLGSDGIITSLDERHARSNTPWFHASPSQSPAPVVLPRSTYDVSAILKICSRRRIPVTAFFGGTSLPGALAATRGGICNDFGRMNKILAVYQDDMDVVVQPAVSWQDLNAELEGHGLFFPPDPGRGARIGGMIAMSCSGTNAYRYGTMKEWLISMTVVLADGTIVNTRHRPRKSSAGHDLTRLIIGSEGTLGLVTEAVLKVTSTGQNLNVAVSTFPSTHSAVKTAVSLIRSGILFDTIELLDKHSMRAINQSGVSTKSWRESPTLYLKFSGPQATVQSQSEKAREAAETYGSEDFDISADKDEIEVLWGARKTVGRSLMAMKKHETDLFLSADAAVPISNLAIIMDEAQEAILNAGLVGSTLGHVGDGEFPAGPCLDWFATLTALVSTRSLFALRAWGTPLRKSFNSSRKELYNSKARSLENTGSVWS
ncbi:MAG: hypothetical protein Q9181_007007 [Wetmoreana brouardii]